MTNPQDLHKKQTEYIRVKETGEVKRTKYVSAGFVETIHKQDKEYVQKRTYLIDEIQFCTPLGFKDGKAEVVENPTEYDGEMICVGDEVSLNGLKYVVGGFNCDGDGMFWLTEFQNGTSVMLGEITNHTPLTEKKISPATTTNHRIKMQNKRQEDKKVSDCCGAGLVAGGNIHVLNKDRRGEHTCKSCGEPCEAVEDTKPDPIEMTVANEIVNHFMHKGARVSRKDYDFILNQIQQHE